MACSCNGIHGMLARMLDALGLTDLETSAYRHLLGVGSQTISEISSALGVPNPRVRALLAQLEEKGLVSRGPGRSPLFSVPPPHLALEALVARREEEVKRARLEVAELLRDLPAHPSRHTGLPPVDVVEGLQATRQRWAQIQRSAEREVCIIDRPPHVLSTGEPNPVELELLGRGIGYRLLYDESSLDVPGRLDIIRTCVAAGEEARVAHDLPLKLVMADGAVALTYDVKEGEISDGLVVHPSPLLDSLEMLFELLWDAATPLAARGQDRASGSQLFDETDRIILELLASGAQDEVVAKRTGMAVRTVRRRVANMMAALGARTRFQAGMRAKERDIV